MIFPAPANAGKTSLFMYLAGLMAQQGYEVLYINADLAASDAQEMFCCVELRLRY